MYDYTPLLKAIDRYLQKADDDLSDTLENEGYLEASATVNSINEIEDELTDILENQRSELLRELSNKGIQAVVDEYLPKLLGDGSDNDEIADLFKGVLESIMVELVDAYIKSTDKDLAFSTFTDRTTDWIQDWSAELGGLMKLSSHQEMDRVLSTALEEGHSIQKVTDQLMDCYAFSRKRARVTAITEILTAHSAAAQEAYRQSPAVEQKMWRHTGAHKNKPRPNHVAIDGQTVDVNEKFELIGADGATHHPEYPRDPILPASERVNCHCITQPVVNASVLGLSLKERRALQQQAIDEDNGAWETESDEKSKAKAGIDENTVALDWFKQKDKAGQIKYLGGKQKWALHEAGLITNDATLKNIKSKTLKELEKEGIITISASKVNHSVVGNYKGASKKHPNGRMVSGGHTQLAMDECDAQGIDYSISYTFSNGVRIGIVPSSKMPLKRENNGQAWFPAEWDADDVLVAGTYVANSSAELVDGYHKTTVYNDVAVRVLVDPDGKVTTICPDLDQDKYLEGVEKN